MQLAFLSKTLLGLLLTPLVLSLERAGITGANNKKEELSSSSLSTSSSAWLLDAQDPSSASHSGLAEYQKHRSTLFFPLLCQLGLPSLCVCTGAGLQAAIDAGNRWVIVCPGATMQLSTEIDLTGASLQIFCGALFGLRPCIINGQGITRLFTGAPGRVTFSNIVFEAGNGVNEVRPRGFRISHKLSKDECITHTLSVFFSLSLSLGAQSILRGGALYFTGGEITVNRCEFNDNRAEVRTCGRSTYHAFRPAQSLFHPNNHYFALPSPEVPFRWKDQALL